MCLTSDSGKSTSGPLFGRNCQNFAAFFKVSLLLLRTDA